jgi:outer membrane murein-binding lipoprotein Lpp
MSRFRLACLATLACGLTLLAGCASFRTAANELDATSRELATEDTTLTSKGENVPDAAITPGGDFLIDGTRMAITPQQRNELLAYRAQSIGIAQRGIAIGHEGVEVGRRAVVPMVFAALFGASEEAIDTRMDKRLAGVREATAKLCDRMPALMAAQRQLAADLPAFEPYATLTPEKIDDCRRDALHDISVADD